MKKKITAPFFEIGVKNYLYGEQVLELAKAADKASCKYDVDVIFITPYTEIRRVSENTERLLVFAPYMDLLRPGRGMADVLPEALKAAGAVGVVLNHSERPVSLAHLVKGIERARELDMLTFVCTDTVSETRAAAQLYPDIINPEPAELIGTGVMEEADRISELAEAVKEIHSNILVEEAAGISTAEQVYQCIIRGADGVGVASGICNTDAPCKMAEEMIYSVYKAKNELKKRNF